jgi:hypothetical protein
LRFSKKRRGFSAVYGLLPAGGTVVITGTPIGTGIGTGGEEANHFVLIQVHFANIIVVFLVIGIVHAGFAFGAHGRPPFRAEAVCGIIIPRGTVAVNGEGFSQTEKNSKKSNDFCPTFGYNKVKMKIGGLPFEENV